MPRGPPSFYHFKINRLEDNGDDGEEKIITRYFGTSSDAAEYLKCSRPTLFKLINKPNECMLSRYFVAERCRIPMFEKVPVPNYEKW